MMIYQLRYVERDELAFPYYVSIRFPYRSVRLEYFPEDNIFPLYSFLTSIIAVAIAVVGSAWLR